MAGNATQVGGHPLPRAVRRRARVTALAATAGLSASLGLAVAPGLGSPVHAAPTPDCAEAYPVADLTAGQPVDGLTVDRGTTPEAFTGEVLGVLDDGIAPGLDMIIMDLDSDAIAAAGGIWQGMSGSPVYAEDGRLIGAVAYGLAWGSSPIAGITPFEKMDDYLGPAAPAPRVRIGDRMAARIAATGDVTAAQAEQGFRQLKVPLGVSGIASNRLGEVDRRSYLPRNAYAIGSNAGEDAAASPDTLIAGGNLAAVLSSGDITYAGVGTVTSVCNGRVVGFGHPMQFIGETSYGLGAADAIYVQPDPLGAPFKLANIGDLGGTITDDRLAGIAGDLGPVPDAAIVTSDLTYGDAQRTGTTDVLVSEAMASVTFYQSFANHDSVLDSYGPGSETQEWLIEGTDPKGAAFAITYSERYRSTYDIAAEASYPLADVVWALTSIPGVAVTSVTSTGDVSDETGAYRVKRIEQKVGGTWVDLTDSKAKVAAGGTLRLRAVLASPNGPATVPFSIEVPKKLAGGRGEIEILGGGSDYLDVYDLGSVAEVKAALRRDLRNDSTGLRGKITSEKGKVTFKDESAPLDLVVLRGRSVRVVVK